MIEIIILIALGYAVGWCLDHQEEVKHIIDVILNGKS